MPAAKRVLIAGCGDVGSQLGLRLLAAGWTVHGLRRNTAALPAGLLPVAGDLSQDARPADWPTQPLDYLVFCAAASRHDEDGYRETYLDGLRRVLQWTREQGQTPRRLLFVSSTGVYAQRDGETVDESSPALTERYSGQIMRDAEQLAADSGIPASSVRLAGIYGPGRRWLLDQVRQGYDVQRTPPLYANRIHRDDAAGLLAHLLQRDAAGATLDDLYLGVDDAPAPLHEVIDWLRERLGVTQTDGPLTVRRAGSKRCSNARARALGWVPEYPSYREGYAAILDAEG